ncbi:hypothetical protein H6503_06705 [Candidatus Woesearchaeota archaeon]|nr:hypothetical protein [Candidatus Woesearchaeota archaeon]
MVTIRGYVVDLKYSVEDKIVVNLYCRTPEGKLILIKDYFRPNFFILPKKNVDLTALRAKIARIHFDDKNFITATNLVKKKINCKEEEFIQIYLSRPETMRLVRNEIRNWPEIINFFEDDISLTRRYLLENRIIPFSIFEANVTEEDGHFKLVNYISKDISFAEPKVMSVSASYEEDNAGQKAISALCCSSEKNVVITWKHIEHKHEVHLVKSEEELLEYFKQILHREKPDLLLFEDTNFRLRDILERAKKYRITMNICMDNTEPYTSPVNNRIRTLGINEIFLRRIISNFIDMSLADNDLDSSYETISGVVNVASLIDDEENQEINMIYRKARLNFMLFNSLFNNLTELFKLIGLRAADILNFSLSSVIEWILIKQCMDHNQIVLNRHTYDLTNEKVKRYMPVIDPVPGVYDDVAIIDLTPLYPQLIIKHGISPDTMECSIDGAKGVLPLILEDISARIDRIELALSKTSNDNLERRRNILTRISNYFYEYLNNHYSRWFSKELLERINTIAKQNINTMIIEINKKNSVTFSDYHELYVELKETEKGLVENLHNKFPESEKICIDEIAKRALFLPRLETSNKKRFAYYTDTGKVINYNIIKYSYPQFVKDLLNDTMRSILIDKNKSEIIEDVRYSIMQLLKKEIPLKDLVITSKLTRDIGYYHERTIQHHIIKALHGKGRKVSKGNRIGYVVAELDEPVSRRSFLLEDMHNKTYDPDYYLEKILLPVLEDILNLKGISMQEVEAADDQMQLSRFLK